MSYIQDFFTSRNSTPNDDQKIGREGRLWYDSETNSIRVSDGVTPGGIFVGTGTPYQLPLASDTVLGGVKVDGVSIIMDPVTGQISSTTGDAFILRPATATTLGGVKVGDNLTIDSNGVLNVASYNLPIASDTAIGGVKVDGTSITIDQNGVISSQQYVLPVATNTVLGGVKVGEGLFLDEQSRLNATQYVLPIATNNTIGGVKVDDTTIKINESGVISYTLPIASNTVIGGVKVGSGLTVNDSGVISTTNDWVTSLTAGTGISLSANWGDITVSTRLATASQVGSVKVDTSTIVVNQAGTISVTTDGIVGTVKSVSVKSARGFFADIANSTTNPEITIGTYLTGILKGDNNTLLSAEANVDYQLPISLTTNRTTGAASFDNNVLNIPQYQGQITLETIGQSGAATFSNNVLNIPQYGSVTSVQIASSDFDITGTNPITRSGTLTLSLKTVPVSKGGTGRTSFNEGYLVSDGVELSTVSTISGDKITGNISGKSSGLTQVLDAEFGGTGYTTLTETLRAMLPSQTGNDGKVLSTNGGGALSWVEKASSIVTSVDVSGGTTGLETTGGPITTAGTITLNGTLKVSNGGTGATNIIDARANLEAAKSGINDDITELKALTVPLTIEQGGTGRTSASEARLALGAAKSGANTDITSLEGLTTVITIAQGGTGASTSVGARNNLSAAKSGDNSDITSLSGLTTPLSVDQGGTGSKTATGARHNLGAAKSGDNSDITSLSGLTTPLSVKQGGTGASTPIEARNNLSAAKSGDNSDITSLSSLTTPLSVDQGGTGLSTMIGPNRTLYSTSSTTLVAGLLPVEAGGTGSSTASDARFALEAAKSGANSDITSLSGLTTPLSIEQGGTGTSSATEAINAILPSQAGKKDLVLTTNGTTIRWDTAKPGAVGANGQLQYNSEGFLAATSRIVYDGRGLLTVGEGSTEAFIISGASGKNLSAGGTSVELKAGSSYDIEGVTIPPAGNVYITAGSGIGLAKSGYIGFNVGADSDEVFRINSTGSWSFGGVETNTGQPNDIMISKGPNLSPTWDPMIASYSKRGMVLIYPIVAEGGTLGGLNLIPHPNGMGLALKANVADIDNFTITRGVSSEHIRVNTAVISEKLLPDQTNKKSHFLTTDGVPYSTEDGSVSGRLSWKKLPIAGVAGTGGHGAVAEPEPGVVLIDNVSINISENGIISVDPAWAAANSLPSQWGNENKILSTDGIVAYWSNLDTMLSVAGVGSDGTLGGVRVDGSTISIGTDGVITANLEHILPGTAATTQGLNYYLTWYINDGKVGFGWNPLNSGLPQASTDDLGLVKPDGITIKIDENGVISTNINDLLTDQIAGYYLTSDGENVYWTDVSFAVASETVTGIVALNTNSIYMENETNKISAAKLKAPIYKQQDDGKLLYSKLSYSEYTDSVKYKEYDDGPISGDNILAVNNELVFGDTEDDKSSVFGLSGSPKTSLTISTTHGVFEKTPGNILIAGGDHAARNGNGGRIRIKSGDGYTSETFGTSNGANITIEAGAGYQGDPNNESKPYPNAIGGSIIFKTATIEETSERLVITNTGAWKIGEISAEFPTNESLFGSIGQPLLSSGTDSHPYWGTVPLEFGGTGATTRVDALNNLLPTQGNTENYVLASNGEYAYWTSLIGNTLIPVATGSRLGVVKPDEETLVVDQDGVISVITGGRVGTVKSIDIDAGETGLTAIGGPITTTGKITLGGTLKIENGGTGSTTSEGAIKKLLPTQSVNTSGKSLVSNGSYAEWAYPSTVISPGVNNNLLMNKNGVIAGISDINYVTDSTVVVGVPYQDPGKPRFFNIVGAPGAGSGDADPISIVIQGGASPDFNNAGLAGHVYIKGGLASGTESRGGDVYIDGGTSNLGPGGNIVFRTAVNPGSPLIERLAIDNTGEWIVNGIQGEKGQVLTANGINQPAIWKFPVFNAGGLIGNSLAYTVINSNLQTLGHLDVLRVKAKNEYGISDGGVSIGGGPTRNPRSDFEISHRWDNDQLVSWWDSGLNPPNKNETSFQIETTNVSTTISCKKYLNSDVNIPLPDIPGDLTVDVNSLDIKSGGQSRLKIDSNGQFKISGSAGEAGQILTSTGSNSPPQWKAIIKAPLYEELTATAGQTIVDCSILVKENTIDTVLNSKISYIQVFINGVLQREGSSKSYTVTGPKQITFNQALQADDEITIYSFV